MRASLFRLVNHFACFGVEVVRLSVDLLLAVNQCTILVVANRPIL